eukprot:TRINITY_DN9439_c0_g1_i4.p1 TRINITY_DN9439_c0_g1~~TRINITY_DN9439_c0_g1_i4.p1  ORF type:complete len:630 (+),score=111.37 TRINITY_DN9439_c0_g1_i4:76-1965(+)
MNNKGETQQGEHWKGFDFVEELDVRSITSTAVSDYVPVNLPPPEQDADVVQEDAPVCPNEAAWDDAKIYQEDIEYARKSVPMIPVKVQEYFLNIAITGGTYDGRSSLQNNLIFSNIKSPESLNDASGATWDDFAHNPSQYLSRLAPIENKKDHVRVYISIQNTPGLDAKDIWQVGVFEKFLMGKIEQYYKMDTNVMVARENMRDDRIDALLYVLPPQLVQDHDIAAMKRFAAAGVAVLPVVNKADSLQDVQREQIRADIIEKLGTDMFQFTKQSMQAVGAHQDAPPFFTVLGNEVDQEVHPYWLVRKYKWGQCEAFRSRDSDLKFLKQLIFEVGFQELKDNTERQYYNQCKSWKSAQDKPSKAENQNKEQSRKAEKENTQQQANTTFYPPIPSTPLPQPQPQPQPNVQHASTSTPTVETTSTSAQSSVSTIDAESMTKRDENVPVMENHFHVVPEKVLKLEEEIEKEKKEEQEPLQNQQVVNMVVAQDSFDFNDHILMTVTDVSSIKGQTAFRLTLTGDSQNMSLRVGQNEGVCLRSFVKGEVNQRPNVYEVWQKTLENSGQRVVRLVIKEFRDSIFYALLQIGDKYGRIVQNVDARPSDAVNLALRSHAPIFVANSVMEQVLKAQNRS